MRHLLKNALEIAVTNKELRAGAAELIGNLSKQGTSGITISEGVKPRVLVFVGNVPVGTDKELRKRLNPTGKEGYKVSTVRNIDLQADIWRTATEEEPFKNLLSPQKKEDKKDAGKKEEPAAAGEKK